MRSLPIKQPITCIRMGAWKSRKDKPDHITKKALSQLAAGFFCYNGSYFLGLNIRSLWWKGNSRLNLLLLTGLCCLPFFSPVILICTTGAGDFTSTALTFRKEAWWLIIKDFTQGKLLAGAELWGSSRLILNIVSFFSWSFDNDVNQPQAWLLSAQAISCVISLILMD